MPVALNETHGVGVRALVNGYWGFFSSAVWTPDEMVRLGQGAAALAVANARGKTRPFTLGTIPVVRGEWTMPVKYDPFTIAFAEKADYLDSVIAAMGRYRPAVGGTLVPSFQRLHKYFASSEGSSWVQTTYISEGQLQVGYRAEPGYHKMSSAGTRSPALTAAGRGWEYFSESHLLDQVPELIDLADQLRDQVMVDIGRYDVVCAPWAAASLLSETIGAATELDRAMGFEANADGTSYVDQPLAMLGTYQMGSPLLTVTANRSHVGGAATVQWDDEAVVPDEFAIVNKGVLVDYQTTREQAAWLAPYYAKTGKPVRSHGCASTQSAVDVTLQNAPNLQLQPGQQDVTFADLVANTEKGIAVLDLMATMDSQRLNGIGLGTMREITKGKLGRRIVNGAITFRAPELWKNLTGLGGPTSTRWFGMRSRKGEPVQSNVHSVGAVPAKFANTAIIDYTRKA
jgi:TldD protein